MRRPIASARERHGAGTVLPGARTPHAHFLGHQGAWSHCLRLRVPVSVNAGPQLGVPVVPGTSQHILMPFLEQVPVCANRTMSPHLPSSWWGEGNAPAATHTASGTKASLSRSPSWSVCSTSSVGLGRRVHGPGPWARTRPGRQAGGDRLKGKALGWGDTRLPGPTDPALSSAHTFATLCSLSDTTRSR